MQHPLLAKEVATKAHAGQFRRDGKTPYIKHPEQVASFFLEGSLKWSVAYLHDVIEDTYLGAKDLKEEGIDEETIIHVQWITHRSKETYFEYIERIAQSPLATKVKIADIFANLSDSPTEKQKEKYKKALKILLDNRH